MTSRNADVSPFTDEVLAVSLHLYLQWGFVSVYPPWEVDRRRGCTCGLEVQVKGGLVL